MTAKAQEHVEALAYLLTTKADPAHERGDGGVFEAYDFAYGLTGEQYLLEGNGPTTWATVVRNDEGEVVFVVLATHGFDGMGSTTLWGRAAEDVGRALRDAEPTMGGD